VTLGISSTKDQIVQGKCIKLLADRITLTIIAAMRLRQLAIMQSIAFIAPPEVYTSVLSLRSAYSPKVAAS
jgi:hypothetical protein